MAQIEREPFWYDDGKINVQGPDKFNDFHIDNLRQEFVRYLEESRKRLAKTAELARKTVVI